MKTNEGVKKRIKKEDRKALRMFLLVLAVCLICGFLLGYGSGILAKRNISLKELLNNAGGVLIWLLPAIHVLLLLGAGIASAVKLHTAKKLFESWDGEDEETDQKMDAGLSFCLLCTNILTVLNLAIYISEVHVLVGEDVRGGIWLLLADVLIFFATEVWILLTQKKTVNFCKQINPEKRGSVFDLKFSKQWEASCDEAEQYRIYKAAYASFRTTQMACLIGCIVGMILDFALKTGLMPVLMVCAIWLVSIVSYTAAGAAWQRKGSRKEN